MPVIVSSNNDNKRLSLSIHQPEKCGTQNTRLLLLETEPYKGNFVYDDNSVSTWNTFVILRNHFDRLLSVWYHSCVDPRSISGIARPVWGTSPEDTFRKFVTRIAGGLYLQDIHILPYTASHQKEFYTFAGDGSKFKHDVQVCNYTAPMKWSANATYLRLENLNSLFPVINTWLGLPPDTGKNLWDSDIKGNHHIKYIKERQIFADKTSLELLEYKDKHGAFPNVESMWDDQLYQLIESCEAYQFDDTSFKPLGLLARHGTDEYISGSTQMFQISNERHQLWKRYANLFEALPKHLHPALDDIWNSFQQEPYFWPAQIVGQPDFWWSEVCSLTKA